MEHEIIRVLIVDDEKHDRELIRHALEHEETGFSIFEAEDEESFHHHLKYKQFDVVLSDFNILGFEGLDVIQVMKEKYPDIPVIIVTGTGSEEIAVKALKMGADDYVIKTPKHIAELPLTIERVLSYRETKKRLLEKEANLASVIENSIDGILVVDHNRKILLANRKAENYLEISEGSIISEKLDLSFIPGESLELDLSMVRADKKEIIVEINVTETVWEGENCQLVILRDVTERKKAESERNLLMKAIRHAEEIVIITDADGAIRFVNSSFTRISGYKGLEVLNQNPRILKSGLHDDAFYKSLWDTITSGKTWHGQIINKRKDGSLFTVDGSISPIRDQSGTITSFVSVQRDVTESLAWQKEKQSLEEQLRQAQKMESVGRLAGGVAHDFNNLLSVILGYGDDLINQLYEDDPLRHDVQEIIRAGERAATLTRQLLAFSRRQTLQPKVLVLNSIVHDMEKMLQRLIGETIRFQGIYEENLWKVEVDPGQIEQVIMNLAVNARDAMPEGGILTLETANIHLDELYSENHLDVIPGDYVMIAMTDTGIGMDESTMEQAFDPFFTTKEPGRGTGLGLSTVYGIVKQSGGNIWVYSEPGQGTTFKIYFPRVEADQVLEESSDKPIAGFGRGELIIVVEDDNSLRKLFGRILKNLGYKVFTAANGGEALLLIEEKGIVPDLVITDIVMPEMGGKVLIDRLKRKIPDLKVLFMSGYTDNAIIFEGILQPDTPFIQKPFSVKDLTKKISELLH